MRPQPLAFVVQRYGEEIVGGAEALCRSVAEMVVPHWPVEVLTTCAKDYISWKNEYPPGVSTLNGVTIRRFPVDFERNDDFHRVFGDILGGAPLSDYYRHRSMMRAVIRRSSRDQQLSCLKLQGPYSTSLLEYLAAHHADYALMVFFTYLYATTYFGSLQVPQDKTVLVPTAHDEAPIHFPIYVEMFSRFPAFVFLTPEERAFTEGLFDLDGASKATIGMPVVLTVDPHPEDFRRKFQVDGPFLLYAGRIDPSKGCDELFRFFQAAQRHLPEDLQLILIGNQVMHLPDDRRIRYLGMLSEQDKVSAMAAATVFINPSLFESFSIVILEAMLCGTPVLVNGHSEVLAGHARRSNAGLYYENYYEFVETLRLLVEDGGLRVRMARNGRTYVNRNYGQHVVESRYLTLFEHLVEERGDEL